MEPAAGLEPATSELQTRRAYLRRLTGATAVTWFVRGAPTGRINRAGRSVPRIQWICTVGVATWITSQLGQEIPLRGERRLSMGFSCRSALDGRQDTADTVTVSFPVGRQASNLRHAVPGRSSR